MTNEGTLRVGMTIRLSDVLYRVDYANESRARIVPLTKKQIFEDNGETTEKAQRVLNISPHSPVEIVTDIDAAKEEIEIAATKREIKRLEHLATAPPPPPTVDQKQAEMQAELKRLEALLAGTANKPLVKAGKQIAAEALASRKPAGKASTAATLPATPRSAGGWRQIPGAEIPAFKPDTLAAATMSVIAAHPGLTTAEIVAAVPHTGAVAACVSRFMQAGYIERVG